MWWVFELAILLFAVALPVVTAFGLVAVVVSRIVDNERKR